ncbi:hypothetical protein Tco_0773333 [Tanacetum coccineum]|uniref:Reverse transcriptase domain-containing protein n=1 Tax=Tanacetum coccineum TaxID=301880 RepID=A0ABQ4ZNG1_9ASTR
MFNWNAVMRVSTNAPPSFSTSSSSNFEFQQMAAALEDKMTLTFRNEMNEMKNMMKALVPTPAPIKAVEERCTTCAEIRSEVQATLQNQINSLKGEFKNELKSQHNLFMNQQNDFQNNLQNMLSGFFQNQSQPSTSTSMTRAGLSYTPVPPIPPPLYDENEPLTEKETEVTKDKVLPSTKDIQPPVIQKSHDPVKPVGSPISPEPSSAQVDNSPPSKEPSKETRLPYPSRVEYEKKNCLDLCYVSKDVNKLLSNKEMLNELVFTRIARDVLVPVGRLTFPADFVVVDFECDYRVPLILDDRSKDVCEPESNDSSPTSTIVEEFESLVEEIIKQKEEVKEISDPDARRRACFLDKFRIINQGRVIHSPKIASVSAISHIFPNNNLEDSFKMGDEDLNFIPNKELDKEDLIPIPRESKIGKDCDFPLCDNFQSFKTFSNPLFEKKDDFPSRNDESIFKEEVQKETLKSYSNPLFEDDEEIISIEVSRQISPKVNSEPLIESLPKDDFDNDDDLFEMDSNNDEWKRILYGEDFEKKNFDSDKIKVFDKSSSNVFKSLSDELEPNGSSNVEGNDLDFHIGDALFSTINEDKVFNPGILVDENSKVHEQSVLPIRKEKKDKSEQNQSKPTRNGKDKAMSEDGKPKRSKPDQPDTARKESQ